VGAVVVQDQVHIELGVDYAFDGPSPFGQFYDDIVTYYGLALRFDF
jgi:hypothetical protein